MFQRIADAGLSTGVAVEQARHHRTVSVVTLTVLVLGSVFSAVNVMLGQPMVGMATLLCSLGGGVGWLLLVRGARPRSVARLQVAMFYVLITLTTVLLGGIHTPILGWAIVAALGAGLLLGMVEGGFWSLCSLALVVVLFVLDQAGVPLPVERMANEPADFLATGLCLMLASLSMMAGFLALTQRAQGDLGRVIERLELEVQERRLAEQAAQVAERTQAAFLATMSHEIRTPMNGVLGMADVLADTGLTPEQEACLDVVRSSGRSLLALLDDILDVSKLEAGAMSLETVPVALPDLAAEVVALLGSRARSRGVELVLSLGGPCSVLGDPVRLRQILLNVVGNAVKFTEQGSVELTVAHSGVDAVLLRVVDTGIGMSPEALERLFKPFTQADDTVTRRFGGTGLGLTIVDRLVRAMDGSIDVTSSPGVGTTFEIRLPLPTVPEVPSELDELSTSTPPLPVGGRVLVVDDNAVNRRVAGALLERQGLAVSYAEDGSQAVAAVAAGGFDLVLMDCQMPVMDGYTATARIRALPKPLCDVPIVGLTAAAMSGDRERVIAAGMDGYLSKPVDRQRLVQVVGRALRGHRPRSAVGY